MSKFDLAPTASQAIREYNHGRDPGRLKIKYAHMAENVFTFFRGSDHLFANRWAGVQPLDAGPAVLICGDLHLENFGAYQTDKGDFLYDINDFDEAAVAPVAFDLVRATTSILLAAEVWQISVAKAAKIAIEFLDAYRTTLLTTAKTGKVGEIVLGKGHGPIWDLIGDTAIGKQDELLDRHTELKHGERRIVRDDQKHPGVDERTADLVREAVESFGARTPTPSAFRVLDVTGRMMGIGSVGVDRYLVLVEGGGKPDTNWLLDAKEAIPSALLGRVEGAKAGPGDNEAQRVVLAQRQLQSKPTAGLAELEIDRRHFRIREMVPDENRSKLDRLHKKPEKLCQAACVVGQLTAWSQFRGATSAKAQERLSAWAESPALQAVLASALRSLDITEQDFDDFSTAYAAGRLN